MKKDVRDYYGYNDYARSYSIDHKGSGKAIAIVDALNNYRRTHWFVKLMQNTRAFLKKKTRIKIERY